MMLGGRPGTGLAAEASCGIGNHDSVQQLIAEGRQKRLNVQVAMTIFLAIAMAIVLAIVLF